MIGKSIIRKDAASKACGTETYIADMEVPGALLAATVRSTIAHGTVRSMRFDPAFAWDSIIRITAENFPGRNMVAMIKQDYPALCDGKVRFMGEALCLLAAEDRGLLEEAMRRVFVEYAPLPAALTLEESLARRAVICEPDNVLARWSVSRGDVEAGMREAELVVEGEYRTGPVEHAYLEPNGIVARVRDGGVQIIGSIQCPYYVHKALQLAFDLAPDKIVVRQAPTGGAFGGKEDFPSVLAVHAAALAMVSGRPVRLLYERHEDIVASSKRHPSLVRHRTGVKKDGTLTAMQIEVLFDGGAYSTMSPVVLQRGVLHATGPYRCPNVRIEGLAMATNHAPRGAFRGFGTPQVIFAVERQMDRVADRLGMDPSALRARNAVVTGDTLSTGQVLKESAAARLVLDRAVGLSDYRARRRSALEKRREKSRIKRGVGLSLYFHGGAFTGSGEKRIKARAAVRLNEDCDGVEILSSTVEMGQGYNTVICQIAAAALQIDVSKVSVAVPDTSVVPDSGPTVASRTTMVIGCIVKKACGQIIESIKNLISNRSRIPADDIVYLGGVFYDGRGSRIESFSSACRKYLESGGSRSFESQYELPPGHTWNEERMEGDAYPCYSWAADVIEVDVDMDTFQITPVKATLVFDPGRAINPQAAAGQFEGGTLQSIGYGSIEEMKYDGGRLLNDRLTTYMIPTAEDCPEFQTEIVEVPFSHGPFGAKGIGELPYDGGAPALAAAVENATGIRVMRAPVTPELLLEEWTRMQAGPARKDRRAKRRKAKT